MFSRHTAAYSLALALFALALPSHAFYGRHAAEAMLTFQAEADVPLAGNPTAESLNNPNGRTRQAALEQINAQVQHLMGTFQSESFRADFGYPGVLGESYDIKFKKVEDGSEDGRKRLTYSFKGKVVFQKEAFRGGDSRAVPIKLPVSPDLIYSLGVKHGENLCTDEHYNSEGDFWYFWDPEKPGCPLNGNSTDVFRGEGTLKKLDNTTTTYPEYNRLYGDNDNGDELNIAVFIGYIDDIDDLRYPNRRDDGMAALKFLEKDLKARGFETVEKLDAFREYANGRRVKGINYYRVYELKQKMRTGEEVTIHVKALLADTMISSRDATFHRYLVPAFREADVLLYDGHSGLGGNLDLNSLPAIRFNPDKYQIFFFNGCSSYPYFNGSFFDAKGGSKNLEVVTSGLPTFTDSAGPNMVAFLDNFLDGTTKSYQRILSELEMSNGDNGTYLTGVNGDEDNRWAPRSR